MNEDGILLESGTNEVELLEFLIADQGFGVNVLKIQAIEQYDPAKVTALPLATAAMCGTYLFRDHTIPLIDLAAVLGIGDAVPAESPAPQRDDTVEAAAKDADAGETGTRTILVMEFNQLTNAFLVDGVNRIHRVSWDAVSPLSSYLTHNSTQFTGSIQIEKREILLLDMERIVAELMPGQTGHYDPERDLAMLDTDSRRAAHLFLAEDSATISQMVAEELAKGDYTDLHTFGNGQEAWDAISRLAEKARSEGRPVTDYVSCLISDIEMPQLDGLTLCRRIKESPDTQAIPVVMFSSLINDQIAGKCEAVHADRYITKPEFHELVTLMDELSVPSSEPAPV